MIAGQPDGQPKAWRSQSRFGISNVAKDKDVSKNRLA